MKIAIEGCCHGELDAIYSHIAQLEARNGYKVDLLLICGDFQAVRNYQDLQCMSVPNKYKQLGGFYKYYNGEAKAPILTICIGGNHEASNYFQELYHGGWIAPNIYFMGHAGVVQVNGIRIAAASGIFKGHDFRKGHFEKMPYDDQSLRSIYHIREYNVRRLSLISSPDIFLSHDWPLNIEQHGDVDRLLRNKKHFKAEVAQGTLGSPPLMGLLTTLKPSWWFAAHLHTKFEATVYHEPPPEQAPPPPIANPDEIVIDDEDFDIAPAPAQESEFKVEPGPSALRNPDEITLSDEEDAVVAPPAPVAPPPAPSGHSETKFLALDKCLPKRGFLEVIDYPTPAGHSLESTTPTISLDPEWLAITRAFHPLLSTTRFQRGFPPETEARDMVRKELEWVMKNVMEDEKPKPLEDVQQFVMTAPGPDLGQKPQFSNLPQPPWYPNPQTEAFCKTIGVTNNVGFTSQAQ